FSKVILLKDYNPLELNLSRDGGQVVDDEGEDYGDDENSGDLGNIERSDIENSDHIEKESVSVDRDDLLDKGKKVLAALADSVGTVDTTGIAMQVDSIKVDDVKPILDAVKGLEKEVKKVPSAVKKEAQMTIGQTLAADSVLRKEAVIPTG